MSASAVTDWEVIDVLITVKAYPSVSAKYGEAVCVAGVRVDTSKPEWVRLFPVGFRDLLDGQKFAKYDVIRLRAQRHSSDRRLETYRPDLDSIEVLRALPAGGHWAARRPFVEPLIGPTMCQLNRGRAGGVLGPSLGLVRPAQVRGLVVRDAEGWSSAQLDRLRQASLLANDKSELEKPAHAFAYRWRCEEPDCRGHTQSIADWEVGQAYREWGRRGYDVIEAIRKKWLGELCAPDRETLFFVGDQHKRPGHFMVLGVFYPAYRPDAAQLALDFAP